MKKENYEKPQVEIIEVKQAGIICTSTSTAEDLQDGGTIDWFNDEEE